MKIKLIFFFILITSPFIYSQWVRTNGPEGISIGSLLTVGDTVYAGTETDGVYASTNDGVSWFPMNSGIETLGIGALAYKSGYLFAGTNGSGVYRSTDRGLTWLPPSNGNNFDVHAMVVKDSYVFVAYHGVYRSSDNGVTWEYVWHDNDIYYSLCADGNKLFTGSSHYCYVSTDDGATWTTLDIFDIWCYYCNGNLVIAGGINKVFVSIDQGNSFTTINIPFNFSIVNIHTIIGMGSELFAGTSYDGVYKSTDMGWSWSPVKTGMGPKDVRALTVTGSSSLVAGANHAGVFRSTNSGANWSRSMSGFPAGSTISGLFAEKSTVLAGTYDGVFRSTDNGLNWNKLIGNKDTVNYAHVRGLWQTGDTIFVATIYQYHATIYRSTDNGVNWEWSGNGIDSTPFLNSVIKSGNILLAGGDNVYYSTDNGNNWNLANGLNAYVQNLAEGGGYVYAICSFDIYRSSDDGVNWIHAAGGLDFTLGGAKDNFACTGTFGARARVTTNNGALWFSSGGFPTGTSVYDPFYVPNENGMVLASTNIDGSRIYASYDNGLFFSPYSDGLGVNAIAECFTATDSFLIAGTDYNGVWRRLRPELVGVASQQNDLPNAFRLEQNYPNPFNPTTNITYSIPKAGFVSLKVFDMLGREVAELVDETKQPGRYSITWDAGVMASGIYFYKLTSGEFRSTKKMVLIK
jgi:hypothetical protein